MGTLITGVTSGLGKFLHGAIPGAKGWKRGDKLQVCYYDTIIHCVHDKGAPDNNLVMLQNLISVPCGRFIYISSVDVHRAYDRDNRGYGLAKLQCEQFVRSSHGNHLIIRPGVMLGPHMRPNTLLRMLRGEKLTVTPDSTFGAIRHASLLPVIEGGESGTVTLSGNAMTVSDIAGELGLSPEYGEFTYQTPPVRATHETITEIKGFIAHDLAADEG